jgi:arylsulfatase A-like enzyme
MNYLRYPFRVRLLTLGTLFLSLYAGASCAMAAPRNVILILVDDEGYGDTDLYGPHPLHRTPNTLELQSLSRTYTNAYTPSPVCSPTRASILTGLWPARTGFTQATGHEYPAIPYARLSPGGSKHRANIVRSASALSRRHYTLAEALKQKGFTCGHFGKWHLGRGIGYRPARFGFEEDWAQSYGAGPKDSGGYYHWRTPSGERPDRPEENIDHKNMSEAIRFIERNKDRRFFLNYWAFSVHGPYQADPRMERMLRDGKKRMNAAGNATYGAMIMLMDFQVGRLIEKLKSTRTRDGVRLFDNTLIVYTSDNGAASYNHAHGARITSNEPLRGSKATGWDGGFRVPLLIRCPDRTRNGSVDRTPVSLVDLYPTILDALNIEPKVRLDGVSLLPTFENLPVADRALFGYYPYDTRVPDSTRPCIWAKRDGWTLLQFFHDNPDQSHRFELYYTRSDIGQTVDLYDVRPEIAAVLADDIAAHLNDTHAVFPTRNPRYKGRPHRTGQTMPAE